MSKPIQAMDIQVEHFATTSAYDGQRIVVRVRGNADQQVHAALEAFLGQIAAEARTLRVIELVLDFEELYFMNSSCLSLLMRSVNALMLSGPSSTYKLRFKSNPNLRWQRRSLNALVTLAQGLAVLE